MFRPKWKNPVTGKSIKFAMTDDIELVKSKGLQEVKIYLDSKSGALIIVPEKVQKEVSFELEK